MKIETGNGQAREGERDRVGERQSGKRMKEPFFLPQMPLQLADSARNPNAFRQTIAIVIEPRVDVNLY